MTEEKTIETREDWNEGSFDKTSADRDGKSGILGIGYTHKESNTQTTMPENDMHSHFPLQGNAEDVSGNNNDGTVEGANTASGIFRADCLTFNRSNPDYVEPQLSSSLFQDSVTISLWVNFDEVGVDDDNQHLFGALGDDDFVVIRLDDGEDLEVRYRDASRNGVQADNIFTPNEDQWYHIGTTYDGDELEVYVDGELEATATGSYTSTEDLDLFIGARNDGTGTADQGFEGRIDQFIFFERALSESEVQNLYFEGQANNNFEGFYESKDLETLEGEADELTIDASVSTGETLTATVVALDSEGDKIDTSDPIDVQDGENTYQVENLQEGDSYRVDFEMEADQ